MSLRFGTIAKISNPTTFVTSLAYGQSRFRDFYIETKDEKFYLVRYFYQLEEEIYFSRFKIEKGEFFNLNIPNSDLDLKFNFLTHARRTRQSKEKYQKLRTKSIDFVKYKIYFILTRCKLHWIPLFY